MPATVGKMIRAMIWSWMSGVTNGVGDALAGRKAVGLDHDRRALLAHISQRVGGAGKAAIGTGRNIELGAQRFRKTLGALELGGGLARTERLDAGGCEIVDDPGDQR